MSRTLLRLTVLLLALLTSCAGTRGYDKPGFVTEVIDGRLWVFEEGSPALEEYLRLGTPPLACCSFIGEGPDGMTLLAADRTVLRRYLDG